MSEKKQNQETNQKRRKEIKIYIIGVGYMEKIRKKCVEMGWSW